MEDIKSYRDNELKYYVLGNILLILYFEGVFDGLWIESISKNITIIKFVIESAFVLSISYVYVFLLDSIIAGDWKFRILYFGRNHMPGCTIFSRIKKKTIDNRFTKEQAVEYYKEIYETMPENKKERYEYENAKWYSIYRKYEKEKRIFVSNRDFLLCRDLCMVTISLLIIYVLFVFGLNLLHFSFRFFWFIIFELVVSNVAMRGKGMRLAYNVIAMDIS